MLNGGPGGEAPQDVGLMTGLIPVSGGVTQGVSPDHGPPSSKWCRRENLLPATTALVGFIPLP